MFCLKCGMGNPDIAQFCGSCGTKLPAPNHASNVQLTKDGSPVGQPYSNKDFYQAFIGEKNQQYYLQKFQQFDREGKTSASWHWPAFFVTLYWLMYRKMWVHALLYFLSPYIALIAGAIIAAVVGKILGDDAGIVLISTMYVLFYAGVFIIPPLYANAWYYKHAQKKIAETAMYDNNPQKRLGILAGRGGTSGVFLVVFFVFFFIAIIGILAAIAIPAYQDYVHRSQNQQAISVGKQASEAVLKYYQQHNKPPHTLADTAFEMPPAKFVQDVSFDEEAGNIVVEVVNQSTSLNQPKIIFTPQRSENGDIEWVCSAQEIPERQLPPECR